MRLLSHNGAARKKPVGLSLDRSCVETKTSITSDGARGGGGGHDCMVSMMPVAACLGVQQNSMDMVMIYDEKSDDVQLCVDGR